MRLYFSKAEQYVVVLLIAALLTGLGVWAYAASRRPRGPEPPFVQPAAVVDTAALSAHAASATVQPVTHLLQVHVTGAVRRSGVYPLARGARVHDAIAAAGGTTAQGYPDALNLAAPLDDGERLYVPTRAEWLASPAARDVTAQVRHPATVPPATATTATSRPGPKPPLTGKINLNTADAGALQRIHGVGPTLAQHIIDYRRAHGPFTDLAQLMNVPKIGAKTYQKLLPYVTL